ncbi:biotin--[acetyl-CoA-carboxylase] ligase [Lacihabitans sp. LS3-19]|uniref:biotin--[acetyl-CoA-carboxylase] ligase n=1 Tax=Lacihabitans sp. LS3-19 TaxID=2487335 RepID=UPI0020CD8C79|nr:biotin--[acetyl-CoA-carboxylase] ligase [Lacihabitans sp. LS3-19]
MVKIQPKTLFVGKNLIFLPTCHSTNDIAAEIIQKSEFIDGSVIITEHQSAGKGQRGNKWESKPGENLLLSIILKTDFLKIQNQFYLSICTAVAVAEAIQSFGYKNIKIKWPNDIYILEKKTGGILIENSLIGNKMNHSIIGIGINLNQKVFENPRATSLIMSDSNIFNTIELLAERICEFFESNFENLKRNNSAIILEKYLNNLFGMNELRKFIAKGMIFEGKITGINNAGMLEIESDSGQKYYDIKEIEYLFNEKE